MHFLKEGQKIRAWVDPPPIIRAMPERKRFFSIDVFPKSSDFRELVQNIFNALKASQQMTLIKTQHCQPESNLDFLSMSSLF